MTCRLSTLVSTCFHELNLLKYSCRSAHLLLPLLDQRLQQPGVEERAVHVPMTRRVPDIGSDMLVWCVVHTLQSMLYCTYLASAVIC
jgi:hypothetical protein